VPAEVLNPRNTWRDKQAYDLTVRDLTKRFEANFKQFETYVGDDVVAAGIRAAA
jgi:phosphoenolpyruvate carboxykinase (ATP)